MTGKQIATALPVLSWSSVDPKNLSSRWKSGEALAEVVDAGVRAEE
jgi:hypothetical protein